MTTVLDILTDAHQIIGATDPYMPLDANSAAFGLRTLNRMLSAWNNEGLMIYTLNRTVFALTQGTQTYTMGTGGTLNTPRAPIQQASVLIPGTFPVEIPVEIFTDEKWQSIAVKNVSGGFPTGIWPTGNYPLNTIYVWPVPAVACSLVLYSWGVAASFATINDSVTFPDGYEEAIVHSLALRIAPSFGITPMPAVNAIASSAKLNIASINQETAYMSVDAGLMGGSNDIAMRSFGKVVDA